MTSRSSRPSTQELLGGLQAAVATRLPATWTVVVAIPDDIDKRALGRRLPDATLTIQAPDGREATVPVEVRQKIDPRDVPALVAHVRQLMGAEQTERPIVMAPYLSPRTRELLTESGISSVTSAGLFLQFTDPAVYIETPVPERDPWAVPRDVPLRTLAGPASGRVVRGLCDFRPPYGVQELARLSETPISSVSRVLGLLDREALVVRTPRGEVTDVRWADLLRRWAQDHPFTEVNAVETFLAPRGLPLLLDDLRETDVLYAVTGSHAASVVAPVASPRLLTIYVDSLISARRMLNLRHAERGANVVLARPFNRIVFARTSRSDGILYAAPSQVAADLLTGPGRAPAEADALLRWMKEHEDAWRS